MAKKQSAQHWQAHVGGWQQSGQTLRAYCAAHGLSSYSFRRWRQRLGQAAAPGQALTLVAVKLDGGAPPGAVHLHSPGGWKIEVFGAEPAWLAQVLRQLP